MSHAKGLPAHQRNTMTKYFPVLQDGAGSRGSELAASGQPNKDPTEPLCPAIAEAACQTDADSRAAAGAQALQAELEQLRQDTTQLRCMKALLIPDGWMVVDSQIHEGHFVSWAVVGVT